MARWRRGGAPANMFCPQRKIGSRQERQARQETHCFFHRGTEAPCLLLDLVNRTSEWCLRDLRSRHSSGLLRISVPLCEIRFSLAFLARGNLLSKSTNSADEPEIKGLGRGEQAAGLKPDLHNIRPSGLRPSRKP